MGIFADRIRFAAEPPTREEVDRDLGARAGPARRLSGYRREGNELLVYTSLDIVTRSYAMKVLVDRGGVLLDFNSGAPSGEQLPTFVDRPWLEHDETSRRAIVRAFLDELCESGPDEQ